jgi:hypothetical protein
MKKTTNLKSLSREPLPSLALLVATVALLAFAPQSVRGGEKEFHANFITQFESVVEFPLLHVTVNSKGRATYMGRTTAFTDDQLVNLVDGSGTATYTLTGAQWRHTRPGPRSSGWRDDKRGRRSHFFR